MSKVLEDGDLAGKLLWGFTGGEDCTLTQLCIVMHCPASKDGHISFKESGFTNASVNSSVHLQFLATYFLSDSRLIWVPLLKRTPTVWSDSW